MTSQGVPISVRARPEAFTFEPRSTAVIVVDMQNDFGSEGGMFDRADIDISLIRATIAPTQRVLEASRRAGMRVVYLKMSFRRDLSDAGEPTSPTLLKHLPFRVGEPVTAPDGSQSAVLVENTWNTEIIRDLAPKPGDLVVSKHRYSGFYGTDLDVILRGLGVKHLVFTGSTTSVCVESTLRDAMFRDYCCLLLSDCTAEPVGADLPRSNHEATLLVTELLFGWVSESSELLAALEGQSILTEA